MQDLRHNDLECLEQLVHGANARRYFTALNEMVTTASFADTGERFGTVAPAVLQFQVGDIRLRDAVVGDDEDPAVADVRNHIVALARGEVPEGQEQPILQRLTPTERRYAESQCLRWPVLPVITPHERELYDELYVQFRYAARERTYILATALTCVRSQCPAFAVGAAGSSVEFVRLFPRSQGGGEGRRRRRRAAPSVLQDACSS
jgi:hypothetical protein